MKPVIPIPYIPNLNAEQSRLLQAVIDAHQKAAQVNKNVSSITFLQAAAGSGRLEAAMAAAILTIGHLHAPLTGARWLYEKATREAILMMVQQGTKVPGFGNSFHKDKVDPVWDDVLTILRFSFPKVDARLNELVGWMLEAGKPLYPNAALFTAAVCSELKIRGGTETSLFVLWRLPMWVDMFTEHWDKPEPEPSRIITTAQ